MVSQALCLTQHIVSLVSLVEIDPHERGDLESN